MTQRQVYSALGTAYAGMTIYKQNLSRERMTRLAQAVRSRELAQLAESDLYWDPIVSIEPDGREEVFDLTVPGPHNFVADDVVVHNSIEQDADVVMFIHPEQDPEGDGGNVPGALPIELIVAKQRNGPTGGVPLVLLQEYTKFENRARGEGG